MSGPGRTQQRQIGEAVGVGMIDRQLHSSGRQSPQFARTAGRHELSRQAPAAPDESGGDHLECVQPDRPADPLRQRRSTPGGHEDTVPGHHVLTHPRQGSRGGAPAVYSGVPGGEVPCGRGESFLGHAGRRQPHQIPFSRQASRRKKPCRCPDRRGEQRDAAAKGVARDQVAHEGTEGVTGHEGAVQIEHDHLTCTVLSGALQLSSIHGSSLEEQLTTPARKRD